MNMSHTVWLILLSHSLWLIDLWLLIIDYESWRWQPDLYLLSFRVRHIVAIIDSFYSYIGFQIEVRKMALSANQRSLRAIWKPASDWIRNRFPEHSKFHFSRPLHDYITSQNDASVMSRTVWLILSTWVIVPIVLPLIRWGRLVYRDSLYGLSGIPRYWWLTV